MYLVYSGNRILTLGEVPKDQVYALKLKGISICFSMLKAALSGSYVNFGALGLAQRKRASPRGEAGTSGFLSVSDYDPPTSGSLQSWERSAA